MMVLAWFRVDKIKFVFEIRSWFTVFGPGTKLKFETVRKRKILYLTKSIGNPKIQNIQMHTGGFVVPWKAL